MNQTMNTEIVQSPPAQRQPGPGRPSRSHGLTGKDKIRYEILQRYPTDELILNNADHISLEEFRTLGEDTPKFAEGLFDEPTTAGGRRKRKRLSEFTEEEKQARRKLKNRVAAQSARDRKRKANQNQSEELEAAKAEILTLKQEIWQLRQENASLREENIQYRHEKSQARPMMIQTVSGPIPKGSLLTVDTTQVSQVTQVPQPGQNLIPSSTTVPLSNENNSPGIDKTNFTLTNSSGGVPLKTNFAPSAERPQSSFRAGTHQQLEAKEIYQCQSQLQQSSSKMVPEPVQGKDSDQVQRTQLSTNPMSAYCMLFLQVILSRASEVIKKLDDQPIKRLNRRVSYAHQMKIQASKKPRAGTNMDMPRHTFQTAVPAISPERQALLVGAVSPGQNPRKRKLPPAQSLIVEKSRLVGQTRMEPGIGALKRSSSPSMTQMERPNEIKQEIKQEAVAETSPRRQLSNSTSKPAANQTSSKSPTLKTSSQPSGQNSASTISPQTKSSKAQSEQTCPVHLTPQPREKSCLICRKVTLTPCSMNKEFLNTLNAADVILKQVHLCRKNQIISKQQNSQLLLLRQALEVRLERLPSDPRNPLIVRALQSNCAKSLIEVSKQVVGMSMAQPMARSSTATTAINKH